MKRVSTVTGILIAGLFAGTAYAQQGALFGSSIYTDSSNSYANPQAELRRKEAQILKKIDPQGSQSALSITLSDSKDTPEATARASLTAQKNFATTKNLALPEKILVDREAYLKEAQLLTKAADEIERLQKINQGLEGTIKALEARVAAIRKVKDQEESKVQASNTRTKELLSMISETKKDLMIAETEVRRLSGVLPSRKKYENPHLVSQKTALQHPVSLKKPKLKSTAQTAEPITLSERRFKDGDRSERQATVVSVEVDKANLRAGPGKNHSILMTVKRGTRLVVETRQNDWLRITAPSGSRAWVSTDVVAFIGNNEQHSSVKIKGYDSNAEEEAFGDSSKASQLDKAIKLIRSRK